MKLNNKDQNLSFSRGEEEGFSEKRIVRSEDLFQGGREVIIEHCQKHYRLLATKAGKLILNK